MRTLMLLALACGSMAMIGYEGLGEKQDEQKKHPDKLQNQQREESHIDSAAPTDLQKQTLRKMHNLAVAVASVDWKGEQLCATLFTEMVDKDLKDGSFGSYPLWSYYVFEIRYWSCEGHLLKSKKRVPFPYAFNYPFRCCDFLLDPPPPDAYEFSFNLEGTYLETGRVPIPKRK